MCALSALSSETLADHHISLGVICGLKAKYEPHDLPPCITANGFLEWKLDPELAEMDMSKKLDALCSAWIE